ncbi:hypothetical protein A5717_26095 [Mycolicibacterium porcinum]|uniref:hypothetical protein n=1 Tax=Mycolicibacterium porcinum TaxID=39693 RepID=UPI00080B0848|nr:hypothetical protein [Mycolicibacterium porcinum]OCB09249.1 hypothetical protein A5717_26095 [Mycolicibacterium porcinum]
MIRRPANPHNIKVTDLRCVSHGGERAELVVAFDVPTHPRIWDVRNMDGLIGALAGYIDDRTRPRWRRIWEAMRR